MSTENAIKHLDAAIKALCLEAYRADDPADLSALEHFTIAEDLKRIDSAIGPKGASIFAHIADSIQEAYVEILVAREALTKARPPQRYIRQSIQHLHKNVKAPTENSGSYYDAHDCEQDEPDKAPEAATSCAGEQHKKGCANDKTNHQQQSHENTPGTFERTSMTDATATFAEDGR